LRLSDGDVWLPGRLSLTVTYMVVGFLKRAEHEDYFDRDTDFTPFSIQA
jgi:hypothetical protein